MTRKRAIEAALSRIDWQQVAQNGGPPCFHVEAGRFCLRAERWQGHPVDHGYVALDAVVAEARIAGRIVGLREAARIAAWWGGPVHDDIKDRIRALAKKARGK